MISYAQNHEDVLLARALADVESGFYIDAGAYDPTFDSVTRHFYEQGWHGINVEPQPAYAAMLRQARPRDVTLELALSDHSGVATLYDLSIGDGVATIDAPQAHRLADDYKVVGESQVRVTTLAAICDEYCDPSTSISFLKVDVEGHERAVIAGADWTRWRPRIVLIEATEPLSLHASHEAWEQLLLDAGYVVTLFDGLNRWYAHRDEKRLIELLSVPVNVLDHYEPYAWRARVAQLEAEAVALMAAPADSSGDSARYRALLSSFENLQERYRGLSSALLEEHARRLKDEERLARLSQAVQLLRSGPSG